MTQSRSRSRGYYWLALPLLGACVEVGHDAEVGCLVDITEPGCRATGGAATGGRPAATGGRGGSGGSAGSSVASGGKQDSGEGGAAGGSEAGAGGDGVTLNGGGGSTN